MDNNDLTDKAIVFSSPMAMPCSSIRTNLSASGSMAIPKSALWVSTACDN